MYIYTYLCVYIPEVPWQLHLIHVISICPWDGSDKYCRCFSLAFLVRSYPPSPLVCPDATSLVRVKLPEKRAEKKREVMRTQSGRRSYCFKADRFIYCPNNHVESALAVLPTRRYQIVRRWNWRGAMHFLSFSRYCYPGFHIMLWFADGRQLRHVTREGVTHVGWWLSLYSERDRVSVLNLK